MTQSTSFKPTYRAMFNPPEKLNHQFSREVEKVRSLFGHEYPHIINGQERLSREKHLVVSPVFTDRYLATFQKGSLQDANDAIKAAKACFPAWSRMNWEERIYLLGNFADLRANICTYILK